MIVEEWRPIVGEWDEFDVSSLGGVRHRATGRPKKATRQPQGYLAVTFTRTPRKQTIRVHVLVAAAFIGPRPPGKLVRHLSGVRSENRWDNLAYGTQAENMEDAKGHDTRALGERNGLSKLNRARVRAIRKLRGLVPVGVLGERLGVSIDVIAKAQRGETWGHVTGVVSFEEALRAVFMTRHRRSAETIVRRDPSALALERHAQYESSDQARSARPNA